MTTYFLLAGVSCLLTASCCFWYFQKRYSRRIALCQQKINRLEDTVWRAQMNPHFLHNCLNSIHALMHQNDKEQASKNLTCLSRLIRKVMENSQEVVITLAEELEVAMQYVALEQLRFGDKISVNLAFGENLDQEKIQVPPLFLQPFLENSLLHGLLPKDTNGSIDMTIIGLANHVLQCTISDNGIGREASGKRKFSDPALAKSLGLSITQNRIAAFNKSHGRKLPFSIRDRIDMEGNILGTTVEIQLVLIMDDC